MCPTKVEVVVESSAVLDGGGGFVSPCGTHTSCHSGGVLWVGALQVVHPSSGINGQCGQRDGAGGCLKIGCPKRHSSLRFFYFLLTSRHF